MIWVKFNKVDIPERVIYLPQTISYRLQSELTIEFGLRKAACIVKLTKGNYLERENRFDKPLNVDISSDLLNELLINESIPYRINFFTDIAKIGPVIGLLMGEQFYYYHDKYLKELTESLSIYKQLGGLFFIFKTWSIDWADECIYGLYYDNNSSSWLYGKFPYPSAVFIRGFQSNPEVINKLKTLTENKVFNSLRMSKWETYKQLLEHKTLLKYLPETRRLRNVDNFKDFILKYPSIVLKPAGLSRGRGVYFIKRIDNHNFLLSGNDYKTSREVKNLKINESNLYKFLSDGRFFEHNYILQPKLELAKVNESPFDIRVVMQKDDDEKWQCTGIECRIAGPDDILTNISRGGQALPIDKTIQLAFGNSLNPILVKEKVIQICMEYCNFADTLGERFAEFGLDIAIDKNMRYWFIEANVRPTFKGFKRMDYKNYIDICQAPFLYAASIAGFRREE